MTTNEPRMGGVYALAVHGGAGNTPPADADQAKACQLGLSEALRRGLAILRSGGSSLDAVIEAVAALEDNPQFNAGRGAVFTHDGGHSLDASIMRGDTLACGAVAGLRTVKNPVRLARLVMEHTSHVLLSGTGAEEFARVMGAEVVDPDYFDTPRRYQEWQAAAAGVAASGSESGPGRGTVGAVALDVNGLLAAAGSTGGTKNARYRRVGDTPLIGAGIYADNATCAVACTGTGEEFIRHAVAHDVHARMAYGRQSLAAAAGEIVNRVLRSGEGGLIAVDYSGQMVLVQNTEIMYRGLADYTGRFEVAI